MILSRTIEYVRNQLWTSVELAFHVAVAGVVAGVELCWSDVHAKPQ